MADADFSEAQLMRHVLIRFAGEIDPLVRRKARQLGSVTRPGHKKMQVFRGYILSSTGGPDRSIVTAIELPSRLGELNNFVFNMDYSSQRVLTPITKTVLRSPKWAPLKEAIYQVRPRGKVSSVFFSCLRLSAQDRMRLLRITQDDSRNSNIILGRSAGITDQNQQRFRYDVEVYGQFAVTKLDIGGNPWPWMRYTVWRGLMAAINDSVSVKVNTLGKGKQAEAYELYIESGYLTKLYGSRVRFVGAPNRTDDLTDTAYPYGDPPQAFFYDGKPVPFPRIFGKRPGDVNSTSYNSGVRNPWAFQSTLEAFGARPQACYPHAAPSGDAALLMFPCVNIPDGFDVMSIEANDEYEVPGQVTRRIGNLSSLSFVLGAGDMLNSIDGTAVMGYGTPLVCLLAVNPHTPLTEAEAALRLANITDRIPNLLTPPSPYSEGARYPHPIREVASSIDGTIGEYLDVARLVEGEPMPDIGAHLFVSLYDLPEWIWPDKVKDAWEQFITATGADPEQEPKCLSDQRMSAVFGEVRSTQIGGELELLFAVTARATTTIPVVNRLREYDRFDQPELDSNGQFIYYGPTEAPVHQTKTALVSVKARVVSSEGRITGVTEARCELLHKDVIGPTRSSLYESSMDAGTAKLPSVMWSGVMAGRRVYLAWAARYVRDEYCGSLEQRTRSYQPGTENGCSFFEDNGRYGPRPDQAAFEELWLMVDGARTIISAPNNGLFVPTIDGQNYYIEGDPYFATLGISVPETNYWLLGIENFGERRPTANDRMLGERHGFGAVFNTVAQISETDLIVLVHPPTLFGSFDRAISLLRINVATGAHRVVFSGDLPDSPDGSSSGRFYSLNCYQREVTREGEVVMPAHLFLRRGSGPAIENNSYLFASANGGESWVMTRLGGGGLGQYIETADMKSGAVDPASPLYKGRTNEQ